MLKQFTAPEPARKRRWNWVPAVQPNKKTSLREQCEEAFKTITREHSAIQEISERRIALMMECRKMHEEYTSQQNTLINALDTVMTEVCRSMELRERVGRTYLRVIPRCTSSTGGCHWEGMGILCSDCGFWR